MPKKKNNSPNKKSKSKNYDLRSLSSKSSGTSGTDTEDEHPNNNNNNNNMPASASASNTHALPVNNHTTPPPADNSPPSDLDRPPDGNEGHVAFPPGTSSPPQGLTQRTNTSQTNKETPPDSVDAIPKSGFDTTPNDNNLTTLQSVADGVSNMGGKITVVEDSSTKGTRRRPVGLTKVRQGNNDKDWMGNKLDAGQTTILFLKDDNSNEGEILKSSKQTSNELSPIRESLEELIEANPMGEEIANTLHDHSRQLNSLMASINEMDKSFDIDSLRDTRENMEQATAAATSKLDEVNANMC